VLRLFPSFATNIHYSKLLASPRLASPRFARRRIGMKRVVFSAYTFAEIRGVCKKRICSSSTILDNDNENSKSSSSSSSARSDLFLLDVFASDGIEFASRKTAGVSGDVRKAMQILRVAGEQALKEGDEYFQNPPEDKSNEENLYRVPLPMVSAACKALSSSPSLVVLTTLTDMEALLIVSLAALKPVIQKRDASRYASFSGGVSFGAGINIKELRSKMGGIAMIVSQEKYNLTEVDRAQKCKESKVS